MCSDCSCGQPAPEPLPQPTRQLPLHTALLQRNDAQAAGLRQRFEAAGVTVVNLLSSPGSGKTALLEALAQRLDSTGLAVIVGYLATDHDGDMVYLTRLKWDIDRIERDHPALKLSATKEMMV